MSGIAALWRPQATVPPEAIGSMLGAMPHRGPDGVGVWADGDVGLGHAMLQTTPESLHERQPLVASGYALTADLRLDNREALLALLSRDLRDLGLAADVIPDTSLLLAAYARWGSRCVDHLVGDFAFAIWDGRRRELVFARDPVGVRQLYLHHAPGRQFALATEIPGLLVLEGVSHDLDADRIADVLGARFFDASRTLYRDVRRVEAGCVYTLSPQGLTRHRYWTPRPATIPHGDLAEQFASLLDEAVRCRMRSAYPIGSDLSGGLDSSSVTVLAARAARERSIPLHTFTAEFAADAGGEDSYVRAVLDALGPVAVPHSFEPEANPFVSLHEEIFTRTGIDRVSGSHYYNYVSARAVGQAGVRVLLTGHDGDTTVGHGWELFRELARAGDWARIRREAEACTARLRAEQDEYQLHIRNPSVGGLVNTFAIPTVYQFAQDKEVIPLLKSLIGLRTEMHVPLARSGAMVWRDLLRRRSRVRELLLRQDHQEAHDLTPTTLPSRLASGFTERLARDQTKRRLAKSSVQTASDWQRYILESAPLVSNFEKYDLYSAAWHVEKRHPYMDVRLIEFMLSVPTDQKLRDGLTRSIVRRGLGDLLPQAVSQRAGKALLTGEPLRLLESEAGRVTALLADPGPASAYIDMEALASLWSRRRALDTEEMTWLENALTMIIGLRVLQDRGPTFSRRAV